MRIRYWIKPDIRHGIDALGLFLAVTMFFALIQAAHDGIVNRNKTFDAQRWWYPIYQIMRP